MTVYSKDRTKQFSILFLVFVFLFTACRKDNSNTIGADFIGARNGFNALSTDTSTIILFSSRCDSVPTRSLTNFMLGDMNDPIFGKTKSNIYTQFSAPSGFSFGGLTIDSVVLQLGFVSTTSFYGNISTPQDISVYELKEQLINIADSGYFSNRSYQISENGSRVSPASIGHFSGNINLTDSFKETVGGIAYTLVPHIRIKLSAAFANKLQRAESSGAFSSDAAFKSYINGLAILVQTPDSKLNPGQGAIVYMNLRSSMVTGIAVYYGGGASETVFQVAPTDMVTNQYSHITNLPLQPYMSNIPSVNNECYVQSNAGVKTRVLLPNIDSIAKSQNIAIIGAQLIFTLADGKEDATYPVPNTLWLQNADSIGRITFLEDYFETLPANYYGGTYDPIHRQYSFNIIRHIQHLINTYHQTGKSINYGMNLIIPADDYLNGIGAGRVVLNTKKVKLNLSYSVIK
jgi:Domain of unknown function (DUF4270)